MVTKKGSVISLVHIAADRRVQATIDTSTNRATASLQKPPGSAVCTIADRNIRDNGNSCACGTPQS